MNSHNLTANQLIFILALVVCVLIGRDTAFGQNQLDDATVIEESLSVADIVYDQRRDVLYASVKSSAGIPNGNSIITLDPVTLDVLDRVLVGSEPNKLAISKDGSRVYVCVEGAGSIRYYEPETGVLGPLQVLNGGGGFSASTAIAEDMVVSLNDPKTVVVSSDKLGSSARGTIEVFNDSGKISGNDYVYGPSSIAFVDPETMFGYQNGNTGFANELYSFDGTTISREDTRRAIISGFSVTIEAAGGLIFANNGQVLDPVSLTLRGRFVGANGQMEASAIDGLAYFYNGQSLKVFDTNSFLMLDEEVLELPQYGLTSLIFAGENRLAYATNSGVVGIISGVKFATPQAPRMNFRGTSQDDWVTFDPVAREITINGLTKNVPLDVTKVHFYGDGGIDNVTCLGDPDQQDFAVQENPEMTIKGESYFFAAHDCAELEFNSDSDSDTCVMFDSDSVEQLISSPGSASLLGENSILQATSVASVYIFSRGDDDSARLRGGFNSERLNANLDKNLVRLTGSDFFVSLSGFKFVNANGSFGADDFATIVDSRGLDLVYLRADLGRYLNATTDYTLHNFQKVNFWSTSGGDIGVFQKTFDSSVAGNGTWESLVGSGYNNTTFGLKRLDIREP